MRPTGTRKLSLFIVSLSGLLLLGCPDSTIRFGAVLPLSGVDEIYGTSIRKGIEVAYEEILANPEYKTPLELDIVDSESDPEVAAAQLETQFGAGALAVIGGVTTDEVNQMIEVVNKFERVLISPSASDPDLTGISRNNFYRIFPSDFTAATKMADFSRNVLGLESVVVVFESRKYGLSLRDVFVKAFEEGDGEVLDVIDLPPHTNDVSGIVERVQTLAPQSVYLASYADGIVAMVKELRLQGFKGRILTTSALATSAAIAAAGEDARDVVLTQIFFELDSEHAHVKKFVNGFRQKFGEDPDIYAAHGYDALKVLAAAIEGRPALPGEMQKGLRDNIKEFPGVTGAIQFNDKGDVQKYPRVYIIGDDLGLYDYAERIQRQQDEVRRKQEELRKRLEELQNRVDEVGD